jgi:hypothetical protein
MHPLGFRPRAFLLAMLLIPLMQGCSAELPEGCTPVDDRLANGYEKIDIDKPGHYCLTEDLHARVELADHPAEGRMISIRASDVVLDLRGHTLGRGRLLKNPGGLGIEISDQFRGPTWIAASRNIVIRNGTLQDFEAAIYSYPYFTAVEDPTYDAQTNTYHFPISNIVLENLIFKNNKKKFEIRVPDERKP